MNVETLPIVSAPARRPRIMLMGEFSAGKSTLANLLMGQGVSPVKVTATQLPPVWYAYGTQGAIRVDASGVETPISMDDLYSVSPQDTRAVKVFLETEVLEVCDMIDMPGTSDPNMAHELWQNLIDLADGVVWCTPSTQAWRQSEAALWDQMPDRLWDKSLLLVTRMDKLLTERDQARVVSRVRREVDGLFRGVFPISLTKALVAEEDDEALQACGASGFIENLIELVDDLADEIGRQPDTISTLDKVRQSVTSSDASSGATYEPDDPKAPAIGAQWGPSDADGPEDFGSEPEDHVENLLFDSAFQDKPSNVTVLPRRVQRDDSRRVRTRPRSSSPM